MDILVISREFPPYVLGGISYHLRNLYATIASEGHNVTVVAGRCGDAEYSPERKPDGIDVRWVDYPSKRAYHLQFPVALKRELRNVDQSEFDVAFSHTSIPFSLDLPTITKIHDCKQVEQKYLRQQMSLPTRVLDSLLNPTRRLIDRAAISKSDRLIFNSNFTHDAWARNYDISTSYDVIYNGVDTDVFYPRRQTRDEEYVLFIGHTERKGLSRVRQFARESSIPVYIAGASHVAGEGITAIGRVSQDKLAEYYSDAIATVHPAEFEAFGNVILESLACGTPVVVSDRCGAAEIIDETCGVVTDDLSRGVDKARGLNRRDCTTVAERYTWENVAEETIHIAEELA